MTARRARASGNRRVLALRALGLGDILTGIPALRGLRRAFASHQLVLAAPSNLADWVVSLGVVDETLPTDDLEQLSVAAWTRRYGRPPEVAVDLHGCGPRSQELLRRRLRPGRLVSFRCPTSGQRDGPAWDADEHEVDRWCRLVRWIGGECGREDLRLPTLGARSRLVVLHPGAAAGSRRWPARRWAAVAASLSSAGLPVAVTGSTSERDLCRAVCAASPGIGDLCGRLSVSGLAALVSGAGLLISGDTGVAHLATAYGTPSVVLFGPTPPVRWGPAIDPNRHHVLWHGHDLSRARPWRGDPHAAAVDPALALITVDEVVAAAEVGRFTPAPVSWAAVPGS